MTEVKAELGVTLGKLFYPQSQLGKNWIYSFLKRYPELRTCYARSVTIERNRASNNLKTPDGSSFALLALFACKKIDKQHEEAEIYENNAYKSRLSYDATKAYLHVESVIRRGYNGKQH
ncbi:hypothetical protein K3495_g4233 [Podosphaera aphanis]|nr:hypothetical protein K3495_g4233 [Podosphaera aphanis]